MSAFFKLFLSIGKRESPSCPSLHAVCMFLNSQSSTAVS
uniref:Uncharacterized protein n=1 Tax=Anguilla anguilla TaxID=7936 RepID=A0A0E9U342_ANGAN